MSFGGIKRTPADDWFSKCIRARAGWACEHCGAQHDRSSRGLHCSHFHGRANWSIRFHPDNCASLCAGCHGLMEGNPLEHTEFFKTRLGEGLFEILLQLKRDTALGKEYRRTKGKGEISAHYKKQFEAIEKGEQETFSAFI